MWPGPTLQRSPRPPQGFEASVVGNRISPRRGSSDLTAAFGNAWPASRVAAGMWLIGCTPNVCFLSQDVSRQRATTQGPGVSALLLPTVASGLTDHIWSGWKCLHSRIAPPTRIGKRHWRNKKKEVLILVPHPSFASARGSCVPLPEKEILHIANGDNSRALMRTSHMLSQRGLHHAHHIQLPSEPAPHTSPLLQDGALPA